jgi:hypothetical protein
MPRHGSLRRWAWVRGHGGLADILNIITVVDLYGLHRGESMDGERKRWPRPRRSASAQPRGLRPISESQHGATEPLGRRSPFQAVIAVGCKKPLFRFVQLVGGLQPLF